MGGDDAGVREVDARVVLLEEGVLPGGDLALEDADDGVWGELQRFGEAGEVVGDADGTGAFRDLEDGLHGGELRVVEGVVGGAEVDRAGLDLLHAAAGADGLVVDADVRVLVVVSLSPTGHGRINKGAACAVERDDLVGGVAGGLAGGERERKRCRREDESGAGGAMGE